MAADLSYVNVSDRRHPTTSRCHSYGLSLASVPFHTPDRQHGTLCRTAFALNQTLQSFGNRRRRRRRLILGAYMQIHFVNSIRISQFAIRLFAFVSSSFFSLSPLSPSITPSVIHSFSRSENLPFRNSFPTWTYIIAPSGLPYGSLL